MLLKVAEKMRERDFYTPNRQQLDGEASWSNLSLVNRSVSVSSTPLTHTHDFKLDIKLGKSSSTSFIAITFDARLSCVFD